MEKFGAGCPKGEEGHDGFKCDSGRMARAQTANGVDVQALGTNVIGCSRRANMGGGVSRVGGRRAIRMMK